MDKDLVTIVWGDSISYGVYDNEVGGWVNRIRLKLQKISKHYFVFNMGIPGQNALDILNRFEEELRNRFNNEDQFRLIFAIGIKDALLLNNDENHDEEFRNNINNIIQIALKYSKDIILMGLIKPDYSIRTQYQDNNVIKIDRIIEEVSLNNQVTYIKLRDILTNEDLCDGLHPNPEGYEKISNIVLKRYK